jgi:5-methylthioadenosine/S-adenosylhomocysteine deaminase
MALLIRHGHVVTMNDARVVFDGGFVAVGDDGRIRAVGPADAAPPLAPGTAEVDARGMIVVPGLVDAHHLHWHHLLAGTTPAERAGIAAAPWPAEALAVSARIAAHALLSGGVTCALNRLPAAADEAGAAATIEALAGTGLRLVQSVTFVTGNAGTLAAGAPVTVTERLRAAEATAARLRAPLERWHGAHEGRVRMALEVHTSAVATAGGVATEEATTVAHRLARELDLRLFTCADDADGPAFDAALRRTGRTGPMHLMELGALDERWLLATGPHLNGTDIALMRESGCAAVYTPLAEAGHARGVSAAVELRRAGIPLALGSGAHAGHGMVDMVEQMKAAMLVQNTVRLDATSMSSEAVLEMATRDGARALGLLHEIGSLEAGKRADIAVFDLRGVQMQVAHKPISTLVTCAGGPDAAWVLVGGRVVVAGGELAEPARADAFVDAALQHARERRAALA